MSLKQLYVRVQRKTGAKKFSRCNFAFTTEWLKVEVGEAEAKRLNEEQMLEVAEEKPDDYVDEAEPAPAETEVPDEPAVDPVAERIAETAVALEKQLAKKSGKK